jgi:phytoene dehydrogenase-like protein
MGTVAGELERAARAAGARIVTGAEVTAIDPAGRVTYTGRGEERTAHGDRVLAGVAPWVLERLCPGACPGPTPVGAQVKVNLLLRRRPALHDHAVPAASGFGGTLHVNESYAQLDQAYSWPAQRDSNRAAGGAPPLTDPTIFSPSWPVRRPRADSLRSAGSRPVADGERRRLARPARARRPRLAEVGARGARRGPAGRRC